ELGEPPKRFVVGFELSDLASLADDAPRDLVARRDLDAAKLVGREELFEELPRDGEQRASVRGEQRALRTGCPRPFEERLHPVEGDGALARARTTTNHRGALHRPLG